MAEVTLRAGLGEWTPAGEKLIAASMMQKGRAFISAALLLRQRDGYEYAVLHLMCQGIEVLGKGYLLSIDYQHYQSKLRAYRHNLVKVAEAVEQVIAVRVLKPPVRGELEVLSKLYSEHLLRYGSGYDLMVNPTTIPSDRVMNRLAALCRLERRIEAHAKTAI
jgi:hypothetical protein